MAHHDSDTEIISMQELNHKYMQILFSLPLPLNNEKLLDIHQPE